MSSKPFDVTLKDLIELEPAVWVDLLGFKGVRSAGTIDADISTLTAAADKVIRIEDARSVWLLNLEPVSSHSGDVPERVHLYSTVLNHRHGLLVRSVVLLLRREANASNLTGVFELCFPDEDTPYEVFRYRVMRLWEMPLRTLLEADLVAIPLAPLTDEAAEDLPEVMRRIEQRMRDETNSERADILRTATFVLLGLRYPDDVVEQLYQGVKEMEDSSTYRLIVSKGEKKILLRQGTKKFGPPDEDALAALNRIKDLQALEDLGERLLEVATWQELLSAPPT